MKIKTSLRAVFAGSLLLIGAGSLRPVFGASAMTTGRVSCSTNTASPTLISAADSKWKATRLINANTDYVILMDGDRSFSTSASTGSARLNTPTGGVPQIWTPDLAGEPYKGALYCVGNGGASVVIDYWRTK